MYIFTKMPNNLNNQLSKGRSDVFFRVGRKGEENGESSCFLNQTVICTEHPLFV